MADKKKKIELIKLTIQIGDTKVNVTKDEARDLHKALSEMFGETVKHEHHYNRPWYWPYYGGVLGTSVGLGLNIGSGTSYGAIGATVEEARIDDDRPRLSYSAGAVTLSADDYRVVE